MAFLKVISFNPASPFNSDDEYRTFLRTQLFQIGVPGDVDVIAFQEPVWALNAAANGIYARMGVHGNYHVFGTAPPQAGEAALFVRKTSSWQVISFHGQRYDPADVGALDITPFLDYVPAARRLAVRRRLVVVQLRNGDREVTVASYHGFNKGITDEENRIINDGLLRSILWTSSFLRPFACWPVVLAADFNPPAIMTLQDELDEGLRDRGFLSLPTLERTDEDGNPEYVTNPNCIDGFFVAPTRKVVCIPSRSVERGAEIIEPAQGPRLRLRNFSYVLVDENGNVAVETRGKPPKEVQVKQEHTHLAYKLDLLVATNEEVFAQFIPPVVVPVAVGGAPAEVPVEQMGDLQLN
jgi:hypothetical protein